MKASAEDGTSYLVIAETEVYETLQVVHAGEEFNSVVVQGEENE